MVSAHLGCCYGLQPVMMTSLCRDFLRSGLVTVTYRNPSASAQPTSSDADRKAEPPTKTVDYPPARPEAGCGEQRPPDVKVPVFGGRPAMLL